ncbi:hypothetical protein V6N11_034159 [Hibiscus sabdariffa]|uniref:RRM domain-containing protein n=1 Tax=Hibiscus sabdariffa TaxID=183260 RepID=A0ABR2S1J9_9ROSI
MGSVRPEGFSVFIIYVSKRIHKLELREAFAVYGMVLDVYITYNNPRRSGMKSTFAFVRFNRLDEALKAVKQGNGRLMDGFAIKVFLENRHSSKVKVSNGQVLKNSQEAGKVNVFETESEWLEFCVIGQIKSMYDTDFVQQVLQADCFKVKVCGWSGYYTIIRFEEQEQIPIFWDLKESLLQSWFSDINTDMNKKKLRIWVCIEGILIVAWQDAMLKTIGSRCGSVIRIDVDTSDVPPFMAITLEEQPKSPHESNWEAKTDAPSAQPLGTLNGADPILFGTRDELWEEGERDCYGIKVNPHVNKCEKREEPALNVPSRHVLDNVGSLGG